MLAEPTPVLREAGVQSVKRRWLLDPSAYHRFTCVDDVSVARVQQDPNGRASLTASASLASDHVIIFEPGEVGETPYYGAERGVPIGTLLSTR